MNEELELEEHTCPFCEKSQDDILFVFDQDLLEITLQHLIKSIKYFLADKIFIPGKLHYRVRKKDFLIQYDFFRVYE